ncbi:MAG: Fe-S cluster assembly ATPase SufC [Leptospiraceae bacterium]|nr:Fe-S cluster assembly ATPase SufC [Leptospiraceae bacterium]
MILTIRDLHAAIDGTAILKGVNLEIPAGEMHVIMGPNGSGKSTLSNVLMGHPDYTVTGGDILLNGQSILNWSTDERARSGMFLSFQHPAAIPGVSVNNLMRNVMQNMRGAEMPLREFRQELNRVMDHLGMDRRFAARYVNDGFSGGEKKRNELLQMMMMQPKLAILDEIDSGLDIDALRTIASGVEEMRNPQRCMLLITHYKRLLEHMTIDRVHVFVDGRIVASGGLEVADRLEQEGYESMRASHVS